MAFLVSGMDSFHVSAHAAFDIIPKWSSLVQVYRLAVAVHMCLQICVSR